MSKPTMRPFHKFTELFLQKYEGYSPSSFSTELTILEKINKVIHRINEITGQWNDLVEMWEEIIEWVLGEGLTDAVRDRLDEMVEDGTLALIINEQVFGWLTNNKQPSNAIYRKKPLVQLPMRFPDYNQLVATYDLVNIYPSAFDIDWEKKELFLISLGANHDGGVMADRFITVYDVETGAYKGCFLAGTGGGEGIVIKYSGASRYLYLQMSDGTLGAYNITVLPSNRSKITPENTYYVNAHWTFASDGNRWLVTQGGSDIGYKDARTTHAYYSNSFTRQGFIQTKQKDWGYFNADEYDDNTKVQTMAIGNGKIYLGIGAYHSDGATTVKGKIGLKVLDSGGEILEQGLMDGQKVIDKLNELGYASDIMENEGVHVRKTDGAVFTLFVHQRPTHANADSEGIIIFQDYAPQMDAIDFSDCAEVIRGTYIEGFQPLSYRLPGTNSMVMENFLTGERLDSMQRILNHMYSVYRETFNFYSTTTPVTWFDGTAIGGARFVEIKNLNNTYFIVEVSPYVDRQTLTYFVTRNHSDGTFTVQDVTPEGYQSLYVGNQNVYALKRGFYEMPMNKTINTYLPSTFPDGDVLTLITVKGSSTRVIIEVFVPTTNQVFIGSRANGENYDFEEK